METVLIVEHEMSMRETLLELLGRDGRTVIMADDEQEALESLMQMPRPSLILLDLSTLRMDGWEFLRCQSANPSIADILTIALSDSARPTGARHQLAKPVEVDRLLALVDDYC